VTANGRLVLILLLSAAALSLGLMPLPAHALDLKAKAAVLMDASSGRILYEHNADTPLPVASLTKMMTLTVALEAVARGEASLDDVVTASEFAAAKRGTRIWLEAGEQMALHELLYAVAVGSANDAAVAVAEHIAGSEQEFVALMNRRAEELGLEHTHFLNSTGLPPDTGPEHTMTARDATVLARHCLTVPRLMDYVSTYEYTMRAATTKIPVLWNSNKLLKRYNGVDGIKTGFTTAAGYCMAATATRDGLRLIAVVLGCPSESAREEDVRTLLDSGFQRYQSHKAAAQGQAFGRIAVWNGSPNWVDAVLAQDFFVTVERGREGDVELDTELTTSLRAPCAAGAKVGVICARLDGQVLATAELVAASEVAQAGFLSLIGRMLRALASALFL